MRAIILTAAALSLTACATSENSPKPYGLRWVPTGTAAIPQQQALAECRYDVAQDRGNFDRLFLLSGQPAITSSGHVQGLSSQGEGMFRLCMSARGYNLAGATPHVGGTQP